jgi:hypothetical protein
MVAVGRAVAVGWEDACCTEGFDGGNVEIKP